jgi:hypothetical protein
MLALLVVAASLVLCGLALNSVWPRLTRPDRSAIVESESR